MRPDGDAAQRRVRMQRKQLITARRMFAESQSNLCTYGISPCGNVRARLSRH